MNRSVLTKDLCEMLRAILELYDESNVRLPTAPMEFLAFELGAESILKQVEADRGKIVEPSMLHLPSRGRLLDIGNAPGYPALALSKHEFASDGVTFSDEWNSTYPSPDFLNKTATYFRVLLGS